NRWPVYCLASLYENTFIAIPTRSHQRWLISVPLDLMKQSPLEAILSLAASASALLVIFHKPLGLSDDWQWLFLILVFVFVIPLFILRRHRRNARLGAGLPAAEKPPSKCRFWLLLVLLIVVCLAGPLWLPYTGVDLPASTQVITSIISCVLAVLAFMLGWRYWNKKV